ncbi:MAG: hypothetical protein LBH07_01185 [Treponema sp.]|jgi:hypothetical protein|nr:hypothetical protein [Treponema sp.]
MVREKKKPGIEALAACEKEVELEIRRYDDIRKQEFKDEMDSGYFFSVVFDTKKERDQWLKERNLTLIEEFFIKAKDFNV